MCFTPPETEELACGAPLLKGFQESLSAEIAVPDGGESFVLLVQAGMEDVTIPHERARKLLDAEVIVAPVIGHQGRRGEKRFGQLKTHLRVAHQVAVLFAVVATEMPGEPSGPGSGIASITRAI